MARYTRPPFQLDKPLFCKIPQRAAGRLFPAGAHFDWKRLRLGPNKIRTMYVDGQFYHSEELEETLAPVVGDGLEELNIESLRKIVDKINEKVKATGNDKIRTCKISNIKDKQIGHIRSWRLYHGEIE